MDRQRTLGIVAHIDAGKTTLTERILFDAGVQRWCGEVDEGTATMDWMRQEQERGISIVAAATRVPWGDHRLQIVDTPGHVDFTAEVERCMRVLDSVIVVLDGVRGVESQTMTVWREADRWRCARIAFVNKMDRVGADFGAAVQALRARFQCRPVPVTVPLFDARGVFAGLGDAVRGRALWFGDELPDAMLPRHAAALHAAREAVVEACADIDEHLLADYVAGRPIAGAQLLAALRKGCIAGTLVPVACGSALRNQGVDWLLDAICDFLPSPVDRCRTGLEQAFPPADPAGPLAALVFKVEHADDEVRNYLRVFGGTLRTGDAVAIARSGAVHQVGELWAMHSSHHEGIGSALPGDIVVLPAVPGLQTGDTLHSPGQPRQLPMPSFSPPVVGVLFEPATQADTEPMLLGLADLQADDPTLQVERDPETTLPLVLGMGELHLEIVAERLRERGRCRFTISKPRVAQRVTCRRSAEGRAAVQAPGGMPVRWAEVTLAVGPSSDHGEVVIDVDAVRAHPAAEFLGRDLRARARTGILQGLPAEDLAIRVEQVAGGGGGDVDEALVQRAAGLALDKAVAAGEPVRLEPVIFFEVRCPAEYRSAVLADLSARGAQIRQISAGQMGALLQGRGRLGSFLGYATRLRSLTQGHGTVQLQPEGMEAVASEPGSAHRGEPGA